MTGHVFLSHAGVESDLARELKQALEAAGLRVWLDVDELRGEQRGWGEAIETAVAEAVGFLVLVNRVPLRRWVTEEVRLALRRDVDLQSAAEDEEKRAKAEGRTGRVMPGFTVIPVLGPDGTASALEGSFLGNRQAVFLPAVRPWTKDVESIRARILAQDDGAAYQLPPEQAPFLGLQAFEAEHSLLFHGRDTEVAQLLDLLRRRDLVAVVGNSGSGKSSLVKAGLIPALHRGRFSPFGGHMAPWRTLVARPGAKPFEGLVAAFIEDLKRAGGSDPDCVERRRAFLDLVSQPNPIGAMVQLASRSGEFVLLVIDQLEELIQRADPAEGCRFVACLLEALGEHQGRTVKVALTLRADYVPNILELGFGDFAGHAQRGLLFSRIPDGRSLRATIEGPTFLTRRRFDRTLVDRLLADVGPDAGSLALLQFTLLQLWRAGGTGESIDHRAYEEIGRLAGAIHQHAEDVVGGLDADDLDRVRRLFVALSDFDAKGRHTRRSARRSELVGQGSDAPRRAQLLDLLVQQRLIVDCDDPQAPPGDPRYEVPHEALLRSWKRLADWIAADGEDARLGRRLREQRQIWLDHGRDFHFGLTPGQLEEAQSWSARDPDGPGADLGTFFEACAQHHRAQADRERELGRRVAGAEDLRVLEALRR